MGSNAEIRQRMETYRSVLLVLNWIGAIALVIAGFVMINTIGGFTVIIIIIAIILGIIGHFFVNVALAIPFILLNNGDYLAVMANKNGKSTEKEKPHSIDTNNKNEQNKEEIVTEYKKCKNCGQVLMNTFISCPKPSCGCQDFEPVI